MKILFFLLIVITACISFISAFLFPLVHDMPPLGIIMWMFLMLIATFGCIMAAWFTADDIIKEKG